MTELVSSAQAGELVGVTDQTILRWKDKGYLTPVQGGGPGHRLLFNPGDVLASKLIAETAKTVNSKKKNGTTTPDLPLTDLESPNASRRQEGIANRLTPNDKLIVNRAWLEGTLERLSPHFGSESLPYPERLEVVT